MYLPNSGIGNQKPNTKAWKSLASILIMGFLWRVEEVKRVLQPKLFSSNNLEGQKRKGNNWWGYFCSAWVSLEWWLGPKLTLFLPSFNTNNTVKSEQSACNAQTWSWWSRITEHFCWLYFWTCWKAFRTEQHRNIWSKRINCNFRNKGLITTINEKS